MTITTLAAANPLVPTFWEGTLTALFFLGLGLALYCVFTIYRNPHFNEIQKLGWLLLALALPFVGPLAWFIRARAERKHVAAGGTPRHRGPLGASLWDPDDGVQAAANYDPARRSSAQDAATAQPGAGSTRASSTRTGNSWGAAAQDAARSTDRAREAETTDTAENPYITRNPDGTRGLNF